VIIKTIAFGKMWRYECDSGVPEGCEERQAVLAGEVPERWVVDVFEDDESTYCPIHRDEAITL
jgi:hypothetical protein